MFMMEINRTNCCISAVICFISILFCCMTLGQFVLFLSSHCTLRYPSSSEALSKLPAYNSEISGLFWDIGLLLSFSLQHSLQASKRFSEFFKKRLGVFERVFYNSMSCVLLQILMYCWVSIPFPTLWSLPTRDNPFLWWVFSAVHFFAWLTIYSGCIIMDISDFMGIKMVKYHLSNMPPPSHSKSEGLIRFHSHMRHPGFSALTVILFCHPVMHMDRWLLSIGLMLYMMLGFKVDETDYAYQKRMLDKKYQSLTVDSQKGF